MEESDFQAVTLACVLRRNPVCRAAPTLLLSGFLGAVYCVCTGPRMCLPRPPRCSTGVTVKASEQDSMAARIVSGQAAPGSARELSVISKLEKLQETIEQRSRVELGDVIRVRGYLRTYREEREVHATTYYKVDDPMWNIQITRMLELPDLYRRVYDQPFHSPASEREEASSNPGALDLASLTRLLSEKVREFLLEKKVHTFYQQELEAVASLLSLANQPVIRGSCSDQASVMEFKNTTTSKAIHRIFKNAIQLLQEKGLVFQKDGGFDNLYYPSLDICLIPPDTLVLFHTVVFAVPASGLWRAVVLRHRVTLALCAAVFVNLCAVSVTREDQDLHRRIHRIIQEDCQKPKHMEKGCHFRHILACAHLSVHPGLSEAVLQQVLELLEDRSDIVGTAERYYMAF
ncbi:CST complex subunit STN1 [Fukomys damarensis]|uniref:CST complex subunit STN1 n=1 Tax=Fukomys damarensis TaxID=885580 RepID=A0A091DQ03_FUKDA|nr:CST complex subunit STN1 [Fukomys damarensis]